MLTSGNGVHPRARIAVDAMGGDHAPAEIVKGAIEAKRQGANVVLVGPPDQLEAHMRALGGDVPVVPATEFIDMDEPVSQVRRKHDSSLHVATRLVAEEEAGAVVSCGNSAAIMMVAMHLLGRQPGIDRAAFGGTLPCRGGSVFVLDIGANAECKAENLVQFAVMGTVYAQLARAIEYPRVALLSNGSEDSKGTKVVKEAHDALEKQALNFIGNIEANQVFEGAADVVVTDGFTGNVLLKGGEGVVHEVIQALRHELQHDFVAGAAATFVKPALKRVFQRLDYEEYGGAPVLGVNGVVINCHGRSRAKAVSNAIALADRMASEHLVERIGEALHGETAGGPRRHKRLVRALHLRHAET